MLLPPIAVLAQNAESVDGRSAAAHPFVSRIGDDYKLRPLRKRPGKSPAHNLAAIRFGLARGRGRNHYNVPISHLDSPDFERSVAAIAIVAGDQMSSCILNSISRGGKPLD
jgi:hypothetical protein